jgi:hypothetical protein
MGLTTSEPHPIDVVRRSENVRSSTRALSSPLLLLPRVLAAEELLVSLFCRLATITGEHSAVVVAFR